MKKTLTILLSLVGVTVAEASIQELFTLTDAAEPGTPLYIPGEEPDALDCSWTFVLTLDPAKLAQLSGKNLLPFFNLTFETEAGSLSTGVGYYPSGPAQFMVTKTGGYVSGATDSLEESGWDVSWDSVSGAAVTLVTRQAISRSSTVKVAFYQYITMNDGTVIETEIDSLTEKELAKSIMQTSLGSVNITSDAVQSATCYYGSATKEEAAALTKLAATGVVPEPTTATLSLLALAGLAARRRRK